MFRGWIAMKVVIANWKMTMPSLLMMVVLIMIISWRYNLRANLHATLEVAQVNIFLSVKIAGAVHFNAMVCGWIATYTNKQKGKKKELEEMEITAKKY